MDCDFIKHYFAYEDTTICVKEIGEGEPIAIIHGWMHSSTRWEKIASELSKGYKVYLIDIPGFGDSTYSDTIKNDLIDTISRTIGILLNNIHENKFHAIIGHSLGGILLYKILEQDIINEPNHLIFCSVPFMGIDSLKVLSRFKRTIQSLLLVTQKLNLRYPIKIFARFTVKNKKFVDDIMIEDALKASPYIAANIQKEVVYFSISNAKRLLNAKVLALRGKYDWVVSKSSYDWLIDTKLSRHEFKESGHTPMYEEEKEFIEVVVDFLRENE